MKNAIFLDETPCDPCKDRRFGGKYSLYHQGKTNQLLVTVNVCS
jgi:hypothetical protein